MILWSPGTSSRSAKGHTPTIETQHQHITLPCLLSESLERPNPRPSPPSRGKGDSIQFQFFVKIIRLNRLNLIFLSILFPCEDGTQICTKCPTGPFGTVPAHRNRRIWNCTERPRFNPNFSKKKLDFRVHWNYREGGHLYYVQIFFGSPIWTILITLVWSSGRAATSG